VALSGSPSRKGILSKMRNPCSDITVRSVRTSQNVVNYIPCPFLPYGLTARMTGTLVFVTGLKMSQ
jgi:hypothetical protein